MTKERVNLTGATEYQLGIIFGIGSYIKSEKALVFKHKEKYFLEQLENLFDSKIRVQKKKDKNQYILKTYIADIKKLASIGWRNRNANTRNMPKLDNYRYFLRAYMELHGHLDYCTSYKGNRKARVKYYRLRLRIYGNIEFMKDINDILSSEFDVAEKSIQIVHNNKTSYIAYASLQEIQNIITYIEGKPCNSNWWNNVREKLLEPTKDSL